MFYTLDRIEDGNTAVLIDDVGHKHDVPFAALPAHDGIGSVFTMKDEAYIFNREQTAERRKRIDEKRKKLFERVKK